MKGGYIIQTPSFEKKKHRGRRNRTISTHNGRNRRLTLSSRNRRGSRRRVKRKSFQKGGSDCVSYGYKGLSDGLGLAQHNSN